MHSVHMSDYNMSVCELCVMTWSSVQVMDSLFTATTSVIGLLIIYHLSTQFEHSKLFNCNKDNLVISSYKTGITKGILYYSIFTHLTKLLTKKNQKF